MSTIRTSIILADNISSTLLNITNAMNSTLNVFEEVQAAGATGFDFNGLDATRERINAATQSVRQFEEQLQSIPTNVPVQIDPVWNIQSKVEIFQNTGVERFNSEMNSLNDLTQMVLKSQRQIGEQALNMDILPPNASWDINATQERIEALNQKLAALQAVDIDLLDDAAVERMNSEFEIMRSNMNSIVNIQDQMNTALESGDISQLNAGYNQLNGIAEQVERRVRETTAEIQKLSNIQWVTPQKIEIFENTGVERFQSEISSATDLMAQLSNSQNTLTQQAQNTKIFPPNAISDITGLNDRITGLREKIEQLSTVQLNDIGAEQANAEIEHLRETLNQALQLQGQFSDAMGNFNVTGANQAFNQLNELIDGTERNFRDRLTQIQNMDLGNAEWAKPQTVDIIVGSGTERYKQEISSANDMITRLVANQQNITQQAQNTKIFPPNAISDITNVNARIDSIRQTIQKIEANPLNSIGTAEINNEVEQLRGQLNQALIAQEQLNAAVDNMDVSGANDAYIRLNSIVDGTDAYIRDNINEQGNFNSKIQQGASEMGGLEKKIISAIAAYASIQGVKHVLGLSDELTQTTARLNMINDGLQTTQDLQNKIFLSAQKTGSSYQMNADVISKLGLQAAQAFGSNDELIAFSEQLNKSFTIAGTSASGVESVMYNLTQALSSGVLRGQDLNSVFSNAPNIIQNIADYLDVDIGKIREMAAEGELSAQVVKNAMLMATEETNAQFETIPKTFSQIGTQISNNAIMAFQPILNRLNEIANSPAFQTLVNNVTSALVIVAGVVTSIFELVGGIAQFASDNWSLLAPIIYAVVAALAIYVAILTVYNTVQAISNGLKALAALQEKIHAAATMMSTGATFAQTAAQYGLNAALLACPITWIILAIIALIALIYLVVAAVNKFAGTSVSATGIIFGAFAVLGAFLWNLFLGLLDLVFGVINAMINPFIRIANFIGNVFTSPISSIIYLFQSMADGVLAILQKIASALDFVFGSKMADTVAGWRSGLKDMADAAVAEYAPNENYQNVMDELNLSVDSVGLKRWEYGDAWETGYSAGENLENSISDFDPASLFNSNIPDAGDYANTFDPSMLAGDVSGINDNTGDMKDTMSASEEDLKYMRDIAERDVINRFTTAEVKVEFGGITNTVNKDVDLDGIVTYLEDRVTETLEAVAEGVHA